MSDIINHPAHYVEGRKYEPIDVIEAWGLGFCAGNALKYLSRAGRKGDAVEDVQKAIWYLERLNRREENRDTTHRFHNVPGPRAVIEDWKVESIIGEAIGFISIGDWANAAGFLKAWIERRKPWE